VWVSGALRALLLGAGVAVLATPSEAAIRYYTVSPCRLVDTRDAALGGPTPLSGGTPRTFTVGGRCGTSPTASGLILNITVTQPNAAGFLTVYPGGTAVPATSNVNFRSGVTRANSAMARVGAGGALSVVAGMPAGTTVHVIIDVSGYFDDTVNNQPPFVALGSAKSLQLPGILRAGTLAINGSVTDDGKPAGGAVVSWQTLSGPSIVTFSPANSASTTATFPAAGTYVLRLSAWDGALGGYADVTVVASPSADAWRLVEQSTWGANLVYATVAQNAGAGAYVDWQIAQTPTGYPTYTPFPTDRPSTCSGACDRDNYSLYHPQRIFFNNALYGNDQLRQRVAFALHKIIPLTTQQPSQLAPYLNIFRNNAFGDFRAVLREMSLNVAMGVYLDMITSTRTRPNENYAREILQLFSVGTDLLNPDGTKQFDGNGVPAPSYTQAEVDGFTKVFTGWTFPAQVTGGTGTLVPNYASPMRQRTPESTYHDNGTKLLLGGQTLAGGGTTVVDLDAALNNIFAHPNVGPFIGKQLIQQLVTSNPSPAYVARITSVFNNDGTGRRGNLGAVVKAILLDTEARGGDPVDLDSGHLKEPVLYVLNILRAFEARSFDGATTSDSYLNPQIQNMGQDLFRPPTVFSYFPADFEVPGHIGLAGPEFGLLSATTALRRANFVNTIVFNGIQPNTGANPNAPLGTSLTLAPLYPLAGDPARLVDEVCMRLLHGSASSQMRTSMITAVNAVPVSNPRLRVQQAIYLAATSSQFQVQR